MMVGFGTGHVLVQSGEDGREWGEGGKGGEER